MKPANSNQPKCAVLLAVYNGMEYLEQQITSIFNQKEIKLTIFVSVDRSTDGSDLWIEQLAKKDSRVIMLPYGERFGGAANNFFRLIRDVDFANFDYIAFADQDDYWYPNKLLKAVNMLKDGQFDAYSSNVTAFWSNGKEAYINKAQPQKKWDFIFEAAGPGCTYVFNFNLMNAIKKHLLEVGNRIQSVRLHDWYCYAYTRAKGYKWYIDPEVSMRYRQHEKNQVGVNLGVNAYMKRFKEITEGSWLKQAYLIANLIGEGDSPFIKSWSQLRRGDLLRLATHSFQCRRRLTEKFAFFCICLMLALLGKA